MKQLIWHTCYLFVKVRISSQKKRRISAFKVMKRKTAIKSFSKSHFVWRFSKSWVGLKTNVNTWFEESLGNVKFSPSPLFRFYLVCRCLTSCFIHVSLEIWLILVIRDSLFQYPVLFLQSSLLRKLKVKRWDWETNSANRMHQRFFFKITNPEIC